jgi:hypothetical protein
MPADAGIFQRERAGSSLRRFSSDFGSGHSLRSETPWLFVPPPANGHPRDSPFDRFPAYGLPPSPCYRTPSRALCRLWRFVVRARPFARIAPRRGLRSRHRRPCRASTCADSSLRSWPVACTPLHTCATHTSARTGIGDRPGFASRLIRFAQVPLGLRCCCLHRPRGTRCRQPLRFTAGPMLRIDHLCAAALCRRKTSAVARPRNPVGEFVNS